jgi:hypothetical protein
MTITGSALIAVLLAIGALHFYWGVGGRWPGHDDASLVSIVAGAKSGRMYGFAACAAVAFAFALAAAIVAARHSSIMSGGFGWIITAGYVVLILVFALRGLAPYFTPIFEYARGTPFFDLNRLYFAPLCLIIAAGLALNVPGRP